MSKVRIAIVGAGNCASSLVQGLEFYRDASPQDTVPGLMHVDLGGYHIRDVEVVAAFDVDAKKVGRDLAEALVSEPNNTIRFADVPPTGVTVSRGRTLDGLGTYYREVIEESDAPEADVVRVLKESGADVLVCYLPVGSEDAAKRSGSARTSQTAAARSHGARSRILRRDHRSMKTPAKGPRIEYGRATTSVAIANRSAVSARSGEKTNEATSDAWNRPSPHWLARRMPNSRRKSPCRSASRARPNAPGGTDPRLLRARRRTPTSRSPSTNRRRG